MKNAVTLSKYGNLDHVRPSMRPSNEVIHDIAHCRSTIDTEDGRVIPVHGDGYSIAVRE